MINVTKTFLPPLEEYTRLLEGIWQRNHITNHGPLVNELEARLRDYLGVKHFFFVSNGTVAIQIALKALDVKGDVITTPFSYVATTSSIVWENLRPVFADIDPSSLTIDPTAIERAITPATSAILATHVYGIPCDTEAIRQLAERHALRVIYDAAHAYGTIYKGRSLINYGDISTLSFHATKLFHTIEGGGIATNDDAIAHRVAYMRNFGHNGQEAFWGIGINGKNSEVNAAMGLCNLKYIQEILDQRRKLSAFYDRAIERRSIPVERPRVPADTDYNHAYYPVMFRDEQQLLSVRDRLNGDEIFPRRYFYPPLHELPYLEGKSANPVAASVSRRVLCLPLYHDLTLDSIERITDLIKQGLE